MSFDTRVSQSYPVVSSSPSVTLVFLSNSPSSVGRSTPIQLEPFVGDERPSRNIRAAAVPSAVFSPSALIHLSPATVTRSSEGPSCRYASIALS